MSNFEENFPPPSGSGSSVGVSQHTLPVPHPRSCPNRCVSVMPLNQYGSNDRGIAQSIKDWVFEKLKSVFGYFTENAIMDYFKQFYDACKNKLDELYENLLNDTIKRALQSVKKTAKDAIGPIKKALTTAIGKVFLILGIIVGCRAIGWLTPKINNILMAVLKVPMDALKWMSGWMSDRLTPFSPDLDPQLEDIQNKVLTYEQDSEVCKTGLVTAVTRAVSNHGGEQVADFLKNLMSVIKERTYSVASYMWTSSKELAGFLFLGKYGPEEVRTHLNTLDEKHYAGVGPIEFLCGVIGTAFLGKWPSMGDSKSCLEFVRMFTGSVLIGKAGLSFAELFIGYLPAGLLYWVRRHVYGTSPVEDKIPKVIMASRELQQAAFETVRSTSKYLVTLKALIDTIQKMLPQVNPQSRRLLLDEFTKLTSVMNKYENYHNKPGGQRQIPVFVRIFGPTGTGKSHTIPNLIRDCLESEDPFYQIPTGSKHWDGATGLNTQALWLDEFGMVVDRIVEHVANAIQLVSSAEFSPLKAETMSSTSIPGDGKGLVVAPKLVVYSGNMGDIETVRGITNIEAFVRRQDFLLEMIVIDEYKKGGRGADSDGLDHEKLKKDLDDGIISQSFIDTNRHLRFIPYFNTGSILTGGMTFKSSLSQQYTYSKVVDLVRRKMESNHKDFHGDEHAIDRQNRHNAVDNFHSRYRDVILNEYGPPVFMPMISPTAKDAEWMKDVVPDMPTKAEWAAILNSGQATKAHYVVAWASGAYQEYQKMKKKEKNKELLIRTSYKTLVSWFKDPDDESTASSEDTVAAACSGGASPTLSSDEEFKSAKGMEFKLSELDKQLLKRQAKMKKKQPGKSDYQYLKPDCFDIDEQGMRIVKKECYVPYRNVVIVDEDLYDKSKFTDILKIFTMGTIGVGLLTSIPAVARYFKMPQCIKRLIGRELEVPELTEKGTSFCQAGPITGKGAVSYATSKMPLNQYGPKFSPARLLGLKNHMFKIDCECYITPRNAVLISPTQLVCFAHGACREDCVLRITSRAGEEFELPAGMYVSDVRSFNADTWILTFPAGTLGMVKTLAIAPVNGANNIFGSTFFTFKESGDQLMPFFGTIIPCEANVKASSGVVRRLAGVVMKTPSSQGDCGLPLFTVTSGQQIQFAGVLTAGNEVDTSFFFPYKPEQNEYPSLDAYHSEPSGDEGLATDVEIDGSVTKMITHFRSTPGQLKGVRPTTKPVPPSPKRTAITKSLCDPEAVRTILCNDELHFGTASLSSRDARCNPDLYGTHPAMYKLDILHNTKQTHCEWVDLAKESFLREMLAILPEQSGDVLTTDEAIVGVPGSVVSMDLSTAVGAPLVYDPLSKLRPGKAAHITVDGMGHVILSKPLRKRLDDYQEARLTGADGLIDQEVVGYLKDEVVPLRKIYNKKTRIIFCIDVAGLIEIKKLTAHLVNMFSTYWRETLFLLGPDLTSAHMDDLMLMLTSWDGRKFNGKICCGDYQDFDLTFQRQYRKAAIECIDRLGSHTTRGWDSIWFYKLMDSLENADFNIQGMIFKCPDFNVSGNYLTSLINCIYNRLVFMSWVMSTGYSPKQHARHVAGGDDNMWSVKPGLERVLTPVKLALFCSDRNMGYTPAEKGVTWDEVEHFVDINEAEIYGRKPVMKLIRTGCPIEEPLQHYMLGKEAAVFLGKFRDETIFKTFCFRKKTTNASEWAMACMLSMVNQPVEMQEDMRQYLMSCVLPPSIIHSIRLFDYVDLERTLIMRTAYIPSLTEYGPGETSGEMKAPAPVIETRPAEIEAAPVPMIDPQDDSTVMPGASAQPFSQVAIGDSMTANTWSGVSINNTMASVTAPQADQRSGLSSWVPRATLTVDSTFVSWSALCPFGLLMMGSATTRSQNMPFENFAFSHGTTEIAVQVSGQKFNQGAIVGFFVPHPISGTVEDFDTTAPDVLSMKGCTIMRLSRAHRYQFTRQFEFNRTCFSNVEGLQLGESDANAWQFMIRQIRIPVGQPSVSVVVYSRFSDFSFALPQRVVSSPKNFLWTLAFGRCQIEAHKRKQMLELTLQEVIDIVRTLKEGRVGVEVALGRKVNKTTRALLAEFESRKKMLTSEERQVIDYADRLINKDTKVHDDYWRERVKLVTLDEMGGGSSKVSNETSVVNYIIGDSEDLECGVVNSTSPELGASVEAEVTATPMHHPTRSIGHVPIAPTIGPMTATQGGVYANTMSHSGVAQVRQEKIFLEDDETMFRKIMNRETVLQYGTIQATMPTGTELFSLDCSVRRSVKPPVIGPGPSENDLIINRLANLAGKWNADFYIRLYTLGNDFQKVNIQASTAYGAATKVNFEDSFQQVNAQVILSGDQPCIEFKIPYNTVTPTLFVSGATPLVDDPILRTSFGFFQIFTAGPLVTLENYPSMDYMITGWADGHLYHATRFFFDQYILNVTPPPKKEEEALKELGPVSSEAQNAVERYMLGQPDTEGENVLPVKKIVLGQQTHSLTGSSGRLGSRTNFEGQPLISLNAMNRRMVPLKFRTGGLFSGGITSVPGFGRPGLRFLCIPLEDQAYGCTTDLSGATDRLGEVLWFTGLRGGWHIQVAFRRQVTVHWLPGAFLGQANITATNHPIYSVVRDFNQASEVDFDDGTVVSMQAASVLPNGRGSSSIGASQKGQDDFVNVHIPYYNNDLYSYGNRREMGWLVITWEDTINNDLFPDIYIGGARDLQMGRWTGLIQFPRTTQPWVSPTGAPVV